MGGTEQGMPWELGLMCGNLIHYIRWSKHALITPHSPLFIGTITTSDYKKMLRKCIDCNKCEFDLVNIH